MYMCVYMYTHAFCLFVLFYHKGKLGFQQRKLEQALMVCLP